MGRKRMGSRNPVFLCCPWVLDLFPYSRADALNEGLRLLVGQMPEPVAQQLQELRYAP
jgi:hypothetical protein